MCGGPPILENRFENLPYDSPDGVTQYDLCGDSNDPPEEDEEGILFSFLIGRCGVQRDSGAALSP